MSELPTEPWHQCKTEFEWREQIATEINVALTKHFKQFYDHSNPDNSLMYLRAITDATRIARGGVL